VAGEELRDPRVTRRLPVTVPGCSPVGQALENGGTVIHPPDLCCGADQFIPVRKAQGMGAVELVVDEVPPVEPFESHRKGNKLWIAHIAIVLLR
jgi:hypothetical protein